MQNCVKSFTKKNCKKFILILWRKLNFSEKSSNMENVGFVKCELKEDMDEEEFLNYDNENHANESLKQHLTKL